MNPLYQHILNDNIEKYLRKRQPKITKQAMKREVFKTRVSLFHFFKDILLIVAGVAAAGFGLKGFLLPNSFIDGGVTGVSLLVRELSGLPLSVLLVTLNIPFILMGFRQIGKGFAVKSTLAIIGLALTVAFIQFPIVTDDKLLVSVFGGFFLGMGIGLAVRGGSVLDGTEVLAIWVSRYTIFTIGDVILLLNILIFSAAAWLLGIETALYAILTYLAASKTVDFIVEGLDEYVGVTIISADYEEIRQMIIEELGRGVTLYAGRGGFGKRGAALKEVEIIFTVVTRLEIAKLKREVEKIDRGAFLVMNTVSEVRGGVIKKKPLAH